MLKHSLRDFHPRVVAELETGMWQAYYRHKFFKLFRLLMKLFKSQFGTTGITNIRMAYYSAKAAKVFRMSGDEHEALKNLKLFYDILHRRSSEEFDTYLAAKAELNWWVVHRYPDKGGLAEALAENMAILYSLPSKSLLPYGRLRAQAMNVRDTAVHKEKREPDWQIIQEYLSKSYDALSKAVTVR